MFTSLVSKTLTAPDDSGTVTIRKLAPKHLEEARQAAQSKAFSEMARLRETVPADMFDRLMSGSSSGTPSADPLLTYDRVTLLRHGVTSWSYQRPVTADSFEDLAEDALEWLAGEVLRLSKPALYGQEATQKNG